ncbi:MAG: hypothetical protein NTX50_02725 [Candidatus Sumerlaeota bacterium]|nr:hypothetical protein [Candidatus Sumerlaeota bacterium]
MRTDAEIVHEGFMLLRNNMDIVEAERFITIMQREKFDYTQWRKNLFEEMPLEEISHRAMEYVKSHESNN